MAGTHKHSIQTKWVNAGNITVENAALGVDGRDAAAVEALGSTIAVYLRPEQHPYAMLLRFRADGNNDLDSVLHVYAARGEDHYQHVAQLTVVTGQQDTSTSTIHFVDTITPASENTLFDGEEVNVADDVALYYLRLLGFDRWAIICSDLDSTTIYADVAYLYE